MWCNNSSAVVGQCVWEGPGGNQWERADTAAQTRTGIHRQNRGSLFYNIQLYTTAA